MQPRNSLSRRDFFATVGASALAAQVPVRSLVAAAVGDRPNILILQPDQHRGTVMGCAGDTQAITPNLDRLAAQGIRFTNCASSSPVCSPFRGSFQTGLYPHRHRVVINNIRMAAEVTCFAEIFAEAGYGTGYIGKWHLDGGWPKEGCGGYVPAERRRGWQTWHGYEKSHRFFDVWQYNDERKQVPVEGYDWEPAWHTDLALDFVRRQRDAGKPWVYYVAYGPPHLPKECPKEFLDRYPPEKFTFRPDVAAQLPKERHDELRQDLQMYYAQVSAVDHEVGRIMAGLEKLGVADNTIVFYTSDHGDFLGTGAGRKRRLRGKGLPRQSAFRIPCILRWPRRIKPGQVCNELVSNVDFPETLLDLAGLPIPRAMQGHSKAGWCLAGKGHHTDALYLGIGDNQPIPPEAFRPTRGARQMPGMHKVAERKLPAGDGIGTDPKRMASGNWDSGYDERVVVKLPAGKRKVMVVNAGKRGRIEAEYTLRGYVDGKPEFVVPTNAKYNFKAPPQHEFVIGRDGLVSNAECLRSHIYAARGRGEPPVFVLDCKQDAELVIRVTKSVGDRANRISVYLDGQGSSAAAKPRKGGWWRAVWDGRYVYRPGNRGWLYDHQTDPHEMTNLIGSPEHAAVRKRLGQRLLELAEETGDPVLPELRSLIGVHRQVQQ